MLTLRGTAGRGGLWLPPGTAGGQGKAPTEQQRSQVRPQGDVSTAGHSSRDRAGPWRGTASPWAAGHQEPGSAGGTARSTGGRGQGTNREQRRWQGQQSPGTAGAGCSGSPGAGPGVPFTAQLCRPLHSGHRAQAVQLLLKLGGSRPFSPLQIISLMQKHRTKTLRLAVIITCKYFQTIRSGRGSVCSLGQSYTGFRLFTTRLIS